jgi:hypothetical protein
VYKNSNPKVTAKYNWMEKTEKELIKLYYDLIQELKVAKNRFEFERTDELKAEIEMIFEELSKRKGKKKIV